MTAPAASLERRYAFKLGGSIFALPLNIVLQAIVPRSLGAADFGRYSFLSAFFTEGIGFLDTGTSVAFYAKLSQRPNEEGVSAFYARFAATVGIAMALGIAVAEVTGASSIAWPDLRILLVVLAAAMAFGNWIIGVVTRAVDAHALTTTGEAITLVNRVLLVGLAAALFVAHALNLVSFLVLQTVLNLVLIGALVWVLGRAGFARAFVSPLSRIELRRYAREYWVFAHPLVTFGLVAMTATLTDRWLLQRFAGSTQQGFYGFGLQIASVIFLLSGAMTALLTREFANAFAHGDLDALRSRFTELIPPLFALTAACSVFLATNAIDLVRIFGGDSFRGGRVPVAILCLLPMHQTYGQLSGPLLQVTSRTRTYRNIGIVCLGSGVLVSWVLLAPARYGGFGLGATGAAIKLAVIQVIIVNAQLISNTRFLSISYSRFVAHQLGAPAVFLGIALLVNYLVGSWIPLAAVHLAVVGAAFAAACGLAFLACPWLFGINSATQTQIIAKARSLVSSRMAPR